MKINGDIERLSEQYGFNFISLKDKSISLHKKIIEKKFNNMPIIVGFDINGPLVSTEDATMTPYPGTAEILQLLSKIPHIKLGLITGWDLATVKYFANKRLGLSDICIISEKGMLYMNDGKIHHLYPHSDTEINLFAESVFKIASEEQLQIAIQPNVSSGCQCVYFEGFNRAKLMEHPCVKETDISVSTLVRMLAKNSISYSIDDNNEVTIFSSASTIYKTIKMELPLFPMRILSYVSEKSIIQLRIDPLDNPKYDWEMLIETGLKIAELAKRSYDLNKDFSIDFCTNMAISKGYSKSAATHEFGKILFGDKFLIFNVGDKLGDIVTGENAIFFPQLGSDAMSCNSTPVVPVKDGREYALIILIYLLNNYS